MNTTSNWHSPSVDDAETIYRLADSCKTNGSDTSYANIFFLRQKYDIEICFCGDFLLRRYNGHDSRSGYGFPLGNGNYSEILGHLRSDAEKNKRSFSFCLLTESQKKILETTFPDKFLFSGNRDDSDYLYMQKELAYLPGKKNQKKRNHIAQFNRKNEEQRFELITLDTQKKDAQAIAEQWYEEHKADQSGVQTLELESIREALDNFEALHLRGGILYVQDVPAAMTIASPISKTVCDIHYEKAIGSFAQKGAYAVINQQFAATLSDFIYINREEDMGIEGLRKSKLSYHPALLLDKYQATEKTEVRTLPR